jgi:hypothetical protein
MIKYLCRYCDTRIDKDGELNISFLGMINCLVCNSKYHYTELIVVKDY